MALPVPETGLVIRYSYLWREEARQGRQEGSKDRPCAVVLAVSRGETGITVVVAPMTHAPPRQGMAALEIVALVRTERLAGRLGLTKRDA